MPPRRAPFRGIVVGASAGGLDTLATVLGELPADYPLPILVVQHRYASDCSDFARYFDGRCRLRMLEPCDKERMSGGRVFLAPANYHMLVERNDTISLSVEPHVHWSRPSIDVLFESAAAVWGAGAVAVLLTGANADGAEGMRRVHAAGGLTVAQDPATAASPAMPQAAIQAAAVDLVLAPQAIAALLAGLTGRAAAAVPTPCSGKEGGP
jgi:two-component system chemotaxis response regulator CheB